MMTMRLIALLHSSPQDIENGGGGEALCFVSKLENKCYIGRVFIYKLLEEGGVLVHG